MSTLDDWLAKSWRNRFWFYWEWLRLRVSYWIERATNPTTEGREP